MRESTKDPAKRHADIGRLAETALHVVQEELSDQQARDLECLLQDASCREDYGAMQTLIRSLPLFASDDLLQRLARKHPALAGIFAAARQVAPESQRRKSGAE